MLAEESLKDLLSRSEYSRQEKLLMCLAVDSASAKDTATVRDIAVSAGLTESRKWNVSDILGRAKGLAIRSKAGWELTTDGRKAVANLAGSLVGGIAPRVAAGLRHHLASITAGDTKDFAEEAVRCFEAALYRASIVLSWVGAIALLQDHVLNSNLAAFNAEGRRRNARWKPASTRDDLSRLAEYDFLQHLEGISVIGKSVKNQLEAALKLRNGCGHPNSLKVGEAAAAAHLEMLVQNVYSQF